MKAGDTLTFEKKSTTLYNELLISDTGCGFCPRICLIFLSGFIMEKRIRRQCGDWPCAGKSDFGKERRILRSKAGREREPAFP